MGSSFVPRHLGQENPPASRSFSVRTKDTSSFQSGQ
jgi:hypothetical protein